MYSKQINKIKVAITTQCNLRCPYCFVKKKNEKMSLITSIKAVNLLLKSEGRDKLLSIYGGEPLLNFSLIEKLVPYAISEAKKIGKKLIISICTNATLLNVQYLEFLRNYNIKLIISLVGKKIYHDKFRKLKDNSGTYNLLIEKLPLIFKIIPKENLGVSYCVFPHLIDKLEDNFKHLVKMGFRYINLEIIREYEHWSQEKIERFVLNFAKIIKYVLNNILQKKFIFLNPINWEFNYKLLSKSLKGICPFNYKLEVYPKGEIAFSPFLFNSSHKENYIIGNVNKSFFRFDSCRFNPKSNKCQRCEYDYFKDYVSDEGASKAYRLYGLLCLKVAKEIQNSTRKIKSFRDYAREINKRICF